MLAVDIQVGSRYAVRVSGDVVAVEVLGEFEYTDQSGRRRKGWYAKNETTGRTIRVRSAKRFRFRWRAEECS